ncbi:ribosomal protein S5 domain 2-type protein [Lineolata rhizophorae]|uniref:Ribosomal RNA-processing protein 43 n=1 Tax=Lineolata rhizophorae TaxID=578093 RepID=A0A6A6P2V2_9PEZI|nr:ribosomal protein S5 domain 2-type protein [Lineolata rhizophorae]
MTAAVASFRDPSASQQQQQQQPPALTLPRAQFAALAPRHFLAAHLAPTSSSAGGAGGGGGGNNAGSVRANGRAAHAFRQPRLHRGSLTHAAGSAVVRLGDTAVVCGVRPEILRVADVPNPPASAREALEGICADEAARLGLLVPNVDLATGCSPAAAHLPGQAPSALAQTLSARLLNLLHASRLFRARDLRIAYTPPLAAGDADDDAPETRVVAYWTLYLDVLVISLDGGVFDAAWLAVQAALSDLRLPHAWWDPDASAVLCSDDAERAWKLQFRPATPVVSATFAVFEAKEDKRQDKEWWVLVDPDTFEEGLCKEYVTVAVEGAVNGRSGPRIRKIEKSGGPMVGKTEMRQLVDLAASQWQHWRDALLEPDSMNEGK